MFAGDHETLLTNYTISQIQFFNLSMFTSVVSNIRVSKPNQNNLEYRSQNVTRKFYSAPIYNL